MDRGACLMGYSPEGRRELGTTEQLTLFHNIKLQKRKINIIKHTKFVTLWTVAHQVPLSMGFSR